MERLPWVDVTYCKYGTPYRKQTRLWTNMRWRPRRSLCRPGSRCKAQRRVLQGPGVGVLAGLHKIVQVEVACDERGGLAVRLVQG